MKSVHKKLYIRGAIGTIIYQQIHGVLWTKIWNDVEAIGWQNFLYPLWIEVRDQIE